MLLAWGQPLGSIVQFAYVVEDVDTAVLQYVERFDIGPWFVRGPFRPPEGVYRGRPAESTFTLARAFTGHTMVELIAQHDESPSVYHERPGTRRYGFHHWARLTQSLDDDAARYAALGCEQAFSDRLPSGSRVVYVDTTRDLPGMIELIEHTDAQERVYTGMYEAAVGWDGSDPIRWEG
jgi:Glyoxalase/Bleomycin resistance protein/Dioxygenase superfamily